MIDWNKTTKEDMRKIHECVKRAVALNPDVDFSTMHMDLEAAHMTCPLKLAELLATDNGNFAHDVFGIARHINRKTGQLEDCFCPRFAA